MATRLPEPGSDDGVWGDILNDFLGVSHDSDGTLSSGVVGTNVLSSDSVTASKIADNIIKNSHISSTAAIDQSKIANLTTDLDSKVDVAGDTMTGTLAINQGNSTDTALSTSVTGDTNNRFELTEDGTLEWGSGSAAGDVALKWGSRTNTDSTTNSILLAEPIDTTISPELMARQPSGASGKVARLTAESYGNNSNIVARRSDGTVGSPAAISSSEIIGAFTAQAYDGTNWAASSEIRISSSEDWTGSAHGTYLSFLNTNNSSTTLSERMRIHPQGALMIGSTAVTPGTSEKFRINTPVTNDDNATAIIRPTATTNKGLVVQAVSSQTENIFEAQISTGTIRGRFDSGGYLVSPMRINAQTGTTYTLALVDAGAVVTLSNASAITLTIDTNANIAFDTGTVIILTQIGAGQVQVAGAGGVTVNTTPGAYLRTQHSTAVLIKYGTNTWNLSGDLST